MNKKRDLTSFSDFETKTEKEQNQDQAQEKSEGQEVEGQKSEEKTEEKENAYEFYQKVIQEKKKKKTVEDTHQRATFLIDKELLKRLDKISKKERGLKTRLVNYAIEKMLDEIER